MPPSFHPYPRPHPTTTRVDFFFCPSFSGMPPLSTAVAKLAHLSTAPSPSRLTCFTCHHLSSAPLPSRLTCRPRRRRAGFPTRRLDPTRPASPPLRRAAVPFILIVAKQANQARTASLREPPPLGVISVTPDGVITGKQRLDRQPRIARKRLGVRPPTPHRQKAAWRATANPASPESGLA